MTDQEIPPERPDNLFQALPGDRGPHGIFDDRARSFSLQWWVTSHRSWLMFGAAAGAAIAAAVYRKNHARQRHWLPGAGLQFRIAGSKLLLEGDIIMAKTAADLLVERLIDWGVDTIFGFPGRWR